MTMQYPDPSRPALPGSLRRLLLCTLALPFCFSAPPAEAAPPPAMEPPQVTVDAPPVIAPPESFFMMISNRVARPDRGRRRWGRQRNEEAGQTAASEDPAARQKRIDAELEIYRAFYKKYIDVNGMPVAAHGDVSDLALQRTYEIVTHMLAGRPDILESMVSNNTYLIVIGKNQVYTDMPEYRNHPNPEFQNERVRGTGGNPTSFGEENLLSLPIDRYDDESIAVHEFCHTIDSTLRRIDPTWRERKEAAFREAEEKGLYHEVYAGINSAEYWAEIAQAWFDCNRVHNWNHGPVGNRAQLRDYDPVGYELCRSAFNLKPEQDWRYTWLQELPMVSSPPRTEKFKDIDPWYTKFTWAREFDVVGRGAGDDALLHANRTIRRMFAYRHDILKVLINDGAKLVVLGADETLADLPEIKGLPAGARVSGDARYLSYRPDAKVLVVAEENVLAGRGDPGAEDNQVIKAFADALYRVAGSRPVIPDFRGNQQYELRVKRLDTDFDEAVAARFTRAMEAGKWKGAPASEDRFAYWTAGVLAYFDAAGDSAQPADAREPVDRRERLRAYDPDLYALVHETMAYGGREDWRYQAFRPEPGNAEPAALRQALASPQQRRGPRPASGVRKARINANWFADGSKFWYRNDLADGAREFILVDAERGTRRPAFDHAAVARGMGKGVSADQLPVDTLAFGEGGRTVTLQGDGARWELDLESGALAEAAAGEPADGTRGLQPGLEPRPSVRNGPDTEITFENKLDTEVEIFWIDGSRNRQSYGMVPAGGNRVQHTYGGHVWLVENEEGRTLAVFEATDTPDVAVIDGSRPRPRERRARRTRRREQPNANSPDGAWTALVRDHNLFIRGTGEDPEEVRLSTDGSESNRYGRFSWSPDSRTLVAWRTEPGERKEVHLVRSSPEGGGRAQLESRAYALPGDAFPRRELNLFDVESGEQRKPAVDRFEHEWLSPRAHWTRDGKGFTYAQDDRGHQRYRVIHVDLETGDVRNVIDERSDTFIWTTHAESLRMDLANWLEQTDEIIYASEMSGWRHLYLVDIASGEMRPITGGEWVVRGIERIDEEARQVWFSASGRNPEQDPYFLHHYRVDFDGTDLVALTEGDGHHAIEFSPDREYVIDTWSRVDRAPVNELRRVSDGTLVCRLEEADIRELQEGGWEAPEVFVAKGRDGKTDIWGIICRPKDFDPNRSYPVLEDIYAGPQSAFVPKSFSSRSRYQSFTDQGFFVVKIDGMGTAHRSKAFHDVCFRNLKDGGFEDRILWMKAAAEKYPAMDLDRVGIYGVSAGGQNAAGAVLFHPEFYKVAAAACGCHDNRLDKASWNEQWMGYLPTDRIWEEGPDNWYAQSSNIDNAHRLEGKLLLIVGEMDSNVPPESTMRLVDALIRGDKDFDLLVVPNSGHGMGGNYGRRRMEAFFARHLL